MQRAPSAQWSGTDPTSAGVLWEGSESSARQVSVANLTIVSMYKAVNVKYQRRYVHILRQNDKA